MGIKIKQSYKLTGHSLIKLSNETFNNLTNNLLLQLY